MKTIIDFSPKEEKIIALYRAIKENLGENRKMTKGEAVRNIVLELAELKGYSDSFDIPGSLKEQDLYDPVGGWIVKKYGSQTYAQNYLKDVTLHKKRRVDTFAVRYKLESNRAYPVLHFHGVVIEVKMQESDIESLAGRFDFIANTLMGTQGVHTADFYAAYPTDCVPEHIIDHFEKQGIGLLRLQIIGRKVNVYEVLPPKTRTFKNSFPHARQRTPGTFIDSIKKIPYLRQSIQRPTKLFYEVIQPGIDGYKQELSKEHFYAAVGEDGKYLSNTILSQFMGRIKVKYSNDDKFMYIYAKEEQQEDPILSIESMTTNYFYVHMDNKRRFRIVSKDEILDFEKGTSNNTFEGNIDDLIETEIYPYIEQKIEEREK